MSMHRIISVLFFTLLLSLCGNGTLQAQGWQDRARKEGAASKQWLEEQEADYCMRQLMYILRNPLYQRATATSMEALTAYLTPESRAFFEQRGGLSNAHAAERLPWPAASSTKK